MFEDYTEFCRSITNVGKVPWLFEGTLGLLSIFREVKKNKAFIKGMVLDIGCGHKPYRHLFNEASRYVGTDISPRFREIDIQADCINLPFKGCQFDCVLLIEVLEHLPETMVGLEEIFRVMKDGAHLLISVPQTIEIHGEPHDFYRYTCFGLKHILWRSGFEVIYLKERGGFFMCWFQELSHFLARRGQKLKILRPALGFIGTLAQIMGLGVDAIFYYPGHTLGYFCVANKVLYYHQIEENIREKECICFEKIRFHGYTLGSRSVKLYFEAVEKMNEKYAVFFHCYPKNHSNLPAARREFGFINLDHEPCVPTPFWINKRVYADNVDLSVLVPGHYMLRFGIFNNRGRMNILGHEEDFITIKDVKI